MSCTSDRPAQPILTITTSKNWVLPPRPKNTRKAKASQEKRKQKQIAPVSNAETANSTPKNLKPINASTAPSSALPVRNLNQGVVTSSNNQTHANQIQSHNLHAKANLESPEDLVVEMRAIELENYHLKTKLLLLIHDYKALKSKVVHQAPVTDLYETGSSVRKRMFGEMGDQMSELITDLNGLSHASPVPASTVSPVEQEASASIETEVFDFVNLEENSADELEDFVDDELDDESDSGYLSRMTSPASESDEHLLMTTLTRSTTVSTTNSSTDKKFGETFKLYDLPAYSEEDYAFSFENMNSIGKKMSIIEEDHYNQVADFLEEKLLSNDVKYYVEKSHTLRLV